MAWQLAKGGRFNLGEMEESVRWRLTMDRRAVEAMTEGSRSDQAEMEAARSDKEGRRRLAELRSLKLCVM